jgi:hypothetical protein
MVDGCGRLFRSGRRGRRTLQHPLMPLNDRRRLRVVIARLSQSPAGQTVDGKKARHNQDVSNSGEAHYVILHTGGGRPQGLRDLPFAGTSIGDTTTETFVKVYKIRNDSPNYPNIHIKTVFLAKASIPLGSAIVERQQISQDPRRRKSRPHTNQVKKATSIQGKWKAIWNTNQH